MTKDTMKACIQNCWDCRDICQTTMVNHALSKGGAFAQKDHIKLMLDCIEACRTCSDFMSRDSVMHPQMCGVCASVCEACAVSCDAMGTPELKACAEACRTCAASCAQMSRMNMMA
ncbi:hypothetical protein MMA231_03696 (plasmid) [Asticcacaulis sp. MM231]